jgi:hypothetical protein
MGVIGFAPLLFPWLWHAQTKPKPSMKSEEMSASTPNQKTKWSQKKLGPLGTVAVLAVVVLVSISVIAVFMTSDESTTTEKPTSEAYQNGESYGLTAGEKARANGNRVAALNDTDVEEMRVLATANQFDSQKEDWIKGFKAGYQKSNNSSDETPNVMTKAEWKAKLSQHFGNLAQMGVIAGFNANDFKKLMGEPSKTQSVGQSAYWYYGCSDGTIQLELNSGALMAGLMQGKINDY